MGFGTFLLRRDILGHKISMNYRGNTSYNTYFGSLISIVIYILVLVQLFEKLFELVDMTDPNITII